MGSAATPPSLRSRAGLVSLRRAFWWSVSLAATHAPGQIQTLPAPPAGVVEAGVPNFVVLGPEVFGMTAAPVEFIALPDGQFAAAALRQIAIGDGTRWQVFDEVPQDTGGNLQSLMVDADGALYAGTGEAVGRIRFGEDGRWWREVTKLFPATPDNRRPNLAIASRIGDAWYWYGASGCLTRWEESETLRYLGSVNTVSHVFAAAGGLYVSDAANGRLFRVAGDTLVPVANADNDSPDLAITGAAPFDEHRTLVSTINRGLLLFDGRSLAPAGFQPLLSGERHLTALCAVDEHRYAVAVENYGLVFFDRSGRILQSLDRTNDHRLARVHKLVRGVPGELWAVLNAGVARVAAPSPVSSIEPLVEKGFTFALPVRHEGRLWLCADGAALRGRYDDQQRLLRFEPDSPAGRYVYQLFPDLAAGVLLASTDNGLHALDAAGWRPCLTAPKGTHILARDYGGDRWFYSAPGEIGWLERAGAGYRLKSTATPALGDCFGGVVDRHDTAWIELGAGRCGRVDLRQPRLTLELYGPESGLGDSWVQLFLYHGEPRAVVNGRVLRFLPEARRFEHDTAFARRFPGLEPDLAGRPVHDALGRFWITAHGAMHVFADSGAEPVRLELPNLYGLRPYYSVTQEDGVVWMHRNNSLVRYDPLIAGPPVPPLRAHIGRVHLLADNRHLYPVAGTIPAVPFSANTLSVQFVAIGAPLGATVAFESLLEGSGGDWTPAGANGTATFTRLKEGSYRLHLRPRIGPITGAEATLAFTVLPPWHRTRTAYALYGVGTLGLFAAIAWLGAYLELREKRRLELLVTARTAELNDSNRRLNEQVVATTRNAAELRASQERYRHLNEELEQRVADRTAALAASNRELEAFSYSISHDLRAPLRNISGFVELLHKALQAQLAPIHTHYLELVRNESLRLGRLIDSLLGFSRLSRAELRWSRCDLAEIVSAVRDEQIPTLGTRRVEWRIGPLPAVEGDPTLLRQVFANLVGNAVKFTRDRDPAVVEVGVLPEPTATASAIPGPVLFVRDNGAGFDPQFADRLFGVFQRLHSAKDFEGTGIGLANVQRIVARHGGRVWAEGRVGAGATFFVALPAKAPASP